MKREEKWDFLHQMDHAIRNDLCARVIANWHDESHLNHFALNREDMKILPQSRYLSGADGPEVAIWAVDKNQYIDLDFKLGK